MQFICSLNAVYMQFRGSFKTTCSSYAVLTKLHVVYIQFWKLHKLHVNCKSKICRF